MSEARAVHPSPISATLDLVLFRIVLTSCLLTLSMGTSMATAQLPECRYDDLETRFQDPSQWRATLLDTLYRLPESYAPQDLVSVQEAGLDSAQQVRAFVIPDLRALVQAAEDAGHPLAVQSAYRSYTYQVGTFNYWVEQRGREEALRISARAGHSEHQLGTTLDFRSADGPPAWEVEDWAQTPAGAWLAENAPRYGFVMSYPKGAEDRVCYTYEPWHYRYVGREAAQAVRESGLTLREWLWRRQ